MSGELWLGLENLHQLTNVNLPPNYYAMCGTHCIYADMIYTKYLKITMKDFDGKTYVAIYDKFKVIQIMMMIYI